MCSDFFLHATSSGSLRSTPFIFQRPDKTRVRLSAAPQSLLLVIFQARKRASHSHVTCVQISFSMPHPIYRRMVYSRIRRDELHDQVCRRRDRAGSHALPARFARIHAGVCCVAAAARLQATCPACIAACPTRALALTLVVARSPTAGRRYAPSQPWFFERPHQVHMESFGRRGDRAGPPRHYDRADQVAGAAAAQRAAEPSCAMPSRATSSQACSRARAAERAQPSAHSRSRSSCSRSSCSSRRRAAAAAADDGESRILYQNCVK